MLFTHFGKRALCQPNRNGNPTLGIVKFYEGIIYWIASPLISLNASFSCAPIKIDQNCSSFARILNKLNFIIAFGEVFPAEIVNQNGKKRAFQR